MNRSVSLPLLSHPRVIHPRRILIEDGGRPALLVPPITPRDFSKVILLPVYPDVNNSQPDFVIRRSPNGAVRITRPFD